MIEVHGQPLNIKLVAPSFPVKSPIDAQIKELQAHGFNVFRHHTAVDSIAEKTTDLINALTDPSCKNILCLRGGYGTSDLLPRIPYEKLQQPKRVIGYSDISALISALWTKKRFVGINGAMPATDCWGNIASKEMQVLLGIMSDTVTTGKLALEPLGSQENKTITGTLFGGCFSVLTNLIATPYFPPSLAGYILFFEDINESVWKLLRYLNHWCFSGILDGVEAIVLGRFDNLEGDLSHLYTEFKTRIDCPVYITAGFGHSKPLYPIPIGGYGTIEERYLTWTI